MTAIKVGYVYIDYTLRENGDATMSVDTDGDLPVVVQLGLLEMAKDTILHPPKDHEEYDGM